MPATMTSVAPLRRSTSLPTVRQKRRYIAILTGLIVLAIVATYGNLGWQNPMPLGTEGFWIIARLRLSETIVMLVVAICQALATVSFQTATNNRIITPSIMGFESLYTMVQTAAVFFLGVSGLTIVQGPAQYLLQVILMVGFAAMLYSWLLSGRYANLHIMLLVGIILGGGLGAVSTFMQRLLSPSEYDTLTARLIGSIANADTDYLYLAIPLLLIAGTGLIIMSQKLNVLSLGRDAAMNLGVNHRRHTIVVLLLVSVLMAVSTSLVGPMTFFGFLVAMLSYQLAASFDHRLIFPVAVLTGYVVLSGAHFVLENLFYAEGSVNIIIELVGGTVFLIFVLRKGRL